MDTISNKTLEPLLNHSKGLLDSKLEIYPIINFQLVNNGIITNIELEHVDHYRNLEHLIQTMKEFAKNCKFLIAKAVILDSILKSVFLPFHDVVIHHSLFALFLTILISLTLYARQQYLFLAVFHILVLLLNFFFIYE